MISFALFDKVTPLYLHSFGRNILTCNNEAELTMNQNNKFQDFEASFSAIKPPQRYYSKVSTKPSIHSAK